MTWKCACADAVASFDNGDLQSVVAGEGKCIVEVVRGEFSVFEADCLTKEELDCRLFRYVSSKTHATLVNSRKPV